MKEGHELDWGTGRRNLSHKKFVPNKTLKVRFSLKIK